MLTYVRLILICLCLCEGADLFLRPAYVPSMQSHRMEVLDANGKIVLNDSEASSRPVTIAGPLCHSTDFLTKARTGLVEPEVGDFVLLLDCGSNTISTFSKHCSRQSPPVFVFRRRGAVQDDNLVVVEVKSEESELTALDFWN